MPLPIPLLAAAAYMFFKGRGDSAGKKEPIGKSADDGVRLVARANVPRAKAWVPFFVLQNALPVAADALARWAGIESGGNPLAQSSIQERGLFQCGPAVAKSVYTKAEWDALTAPGTTKEEHARLAMKLARWCWSRALKYIHNAPSNPVDQIWYAKLYHQWPVDVAKGGMHGPALLMAKELATKWAGNARRMHYLRAANVVAWNTAEP